jgi:hypothetical protein
MHVFSAELSSKIFEMSRILFKSTDLSIFFTWIKDKKKYLFDGFFIQRFIPVGFFFCKSTVKLAVHPNTFDNRIYLPFFIPCNTHFFHFSVFMLALGPLSEQESKNEEPILAAP